ncbi:hypothetical protein [Sporichthya polymorpha]|uniref:hypothetical protein n=1 Tax=Sporichthya polymorpha TaxID=35751 RepID=UPI00036596E9|nr:hypothetical protein [Sporichthya polymorpha]
MTTAPLDRAHEVADALLEKNAGTFGPTLPIYRGHVHRVIGLVGLQTEVRPDTADALGVAAFFHDAGIWFDRTWDYLPPSAARAVEELGGPGAPQADLVAAMITEHHRIRKARHDDPLVEAFRRADLTDVAAGLINVPGARRSDYRALTATYPARGFRPLLVRAAARGIRENPLRPAPMLKF